MQQNKHSQREPSLLQLIRQPWTPWAKQAALFLCGQWISMLGSTVVQFAILWYILRSTNSGAMLAIGALCSFLPQALVAPFAGALANRMGRKRLILCADIGIALVTFVLALLYLNGYGGLTWLFLLSIVRGIGAGLQAPTVGTLLAHLVPNEHLPRIHAASSSAQSFSALIPPVISAWMLSTLSLATIFFLDVATAAIGVTLLLLLHLPRQSEQADPGAKPPVVTLGKSIALTWNARPLRALLGFFALTTLLIVPVSMLSPLLVLRAYGPDYWLLTQLEIAYGIGAMIGGLWFDILGKWKKRTHAMVLAVALFGLLAVLLGIPMRFAWFLALIGMVGLCVPLFSGACLSILHDDNDSARVQGLLGLQQLLAMLCLPIGMAVFGPLADAVAVRTLYIVTGIAMLLLSFVMLRNKPLSEAGKAQEQEAASKMGEGGPAC